jgi:SAM-dependent methyltransferase
MDSSSDQSQPTAPVDGPEQDGFYVQDLDFRSGINASQSPLWIALTAAVGGFPPPDLGQPFTYCDLGCGDGTTVNALAELYPHARFIGVDFNAGHVATGRETARACGLENVQFEQAAFSEMAGRLPACDIVATNGIYAWLPEKEVRAVRALLQEILRPGGLFYVEYTSLPGKISVQPLWSLIQHLVPQREGEDVRERAQRGLDLTEALAKRGMAYLQAHRPAANGAQSYIRGRRRDPYRVDHFAHNAMASGFRPRYFAEMYDEMAAAGLIYAGRTELARNEVELCVPPAQVPTLQDYKGDVRTCETLKDYVRNEQQRRDVFVKDGVKDEAAAASWLDGIGLLSRMPARNVRRGIPTMGNQTVPLRGPAFEGIIAAAETDAVTTAQVAEERGLPLDRVRRAAVRLIATNQFFVCRGAIDTDGPEPGTVESIQMPSATNRRTLRLAAERLTQNQLISAVTGGPAIPVSPIEAVLLQATIDAGGFMGAAAEAKRRLAEETRPLASPSGQKPANALTEAELDEVLQAMRGQKLLNMLRLGIVMPA